jgi:hypothetical protein
VFRKRGEAEAAVAQLTKSRDAFAPDSAEDKLIIQAVFVEDNVNCVRKFDLSALEGLSDGPVLYDFSQHLGRKLPQNLEGLHEAVAYGDVALDDLPGSREAFHFALQDPHETLQDELQARGILFQIAAYCVVAGLAAVAPEMSLQSQVGSALTLPVLAVSFSPWLVRRLGGIGFQHLQVVVALGLVTVGGLYQSLGKEKFMRLINSS